MHQEKHEKVSLNCWVSNFSAEHYDKIKSAVTGYWKKSLWASAKSYTLGFWNMKKFQIENSQNGLQSS